MQGWMDGWSINRHTWTMHTGRMEGSLQTHGGGKDGSHTHTHREDDKAHTGRMDGAVKHRAGH